MATEIIKLQNVQSKYEKELKSVLLYMNKYLGEEKSDYFASASNDFDYRVRDEKSAHTEIKEVAELMRDVKHRLLNDSSNNDLNPKDIKERMIDMQHIILDIRKKELSFLKKIKSEEDLLNYDNKDIVFEDKITQWSTPINFDAIFGKKSIKFKHSCKEVNDFFEFLTKSGGNTNGWSQDDHNIFLKTRSTVKSQQKLVALLHKKLTTKTEYEIKGHIEWYSKYLQLRNRKLQAINQWKSERKVINVTSPLSASTSSEPHDFKRFDKNNRYKIKEKLSEWKKEKEDKKLQELHINHTLRRRRYERERQKEHERKVIKKDIDNWKTAKSYHEQLEREQKEILTILDKKYREREANKKIKSFQAKDNNYLKKRLTIKKRSRSFEIHKPKKEAHRDPNRLLKPTKQWLNRHTSANSNNTPNSFLYINHVSRLAIPEWRKSLG